MLDTNTYRNMGLTLSRDIRLDIERLCDEIDKSREEVDKSREEVDKFREENRKLVSGRRFTEEQESQAASAIDRIKHLDAKLYMQEEAVIRLKEENQQLDEEMADVLKLTNVAHRKAICEDDAEIKRLEFQVCIRDDAIAVRDKRIVELKSMFSHTVDGAPIVVGKTRVFFSNGFFDIGCRSGIVFCYTVSDMYNQNYVRVIVKDGNRRIGDFIVPLSECYSTEAAWAVGLHREGPRDAMSSTS